MRLVCPNCDAQYEIDDGLIPQSGRDVQCSNCGHTWFEGQAAPEEPPLSIDADWQDWSEPQAAEAPPPDSPAPDPTPSSAPRKPTLDPDVAEILREEAAYERAARAAEAQIESQPDLGLAAPAPKRIDHTSDQPRRDLLPDIETINGSLRSDESQPRPAPRSTRRGGGFWRGFSFVVGLVLLAVAIYVLAPRIMEQTPDHVDVWLQSYVDWVDEMRLKLDLGLQKLIDKAQNTQG